MIFSVPWTDEFEQLPQGSESIAYGDERIRELKRSIRERVTGGWWDETATPTYIGQTRFTLPGDLSPRYVPYRPLALEQGDDIAFTTVLSSWYEAGADRTAVEVRDPVVLSTISNVYYGPGSLTLLVGLGASDVRVHKKGMAEVDPRLYRTVVGRNCEIVRAYGLVNTPPEGGDLVMDIKRSEATIFQPGKEFIIPEGGYSVEISEFALTTLTPWNVLRFSVESVGTTVAGGDDLMITLLLK